MCRRELNHDVTLLVLRRVRWLTCGSWEMKGIFVLSCFPEKLTLVSSEKLGFRAFKLRFLAFGLIQGKKLENFFKFFLFSALQSFFLHFEPILVDFGHCSIDLEVGEVAFQFFSLFWDCT